MSRVGAGIPPKHRREAQKALLDMFFSATGLPIGLYDVQGGSLEAVFSQMKNDSKLVLIEFKEGKLPEGPPEDMKIPLEKMVSITTNAGFVNLKQTDELLPYQYYLEFKK